MVLFLGNCYSKESYTTSKIQPCDAGMFSPINFDYITFQPEPAIDLGNSDTAYIYDVHILTAMQAFKTIWRDLPVSDIQNCCKHTGILAGVATSRVSNYLTQHREHLQGVVNELESVRGRMEPVAFGISLNMWTCLPSTRTRNKMMMLVKAGQCKPQLIRSINKGHV